MKIKKDFVTNSSSASFIFEDRRKNQESLVVRFAGGCLNLFGISGFHLSSYKNINKFREELGTDDVRDSIVNRISKRGNTTHIISGQNSNEFMFLLINLIGDKKGIQFPEGVKLLDAVDQGESIL